MIKTLALAQMITMVALAVLFYRGGDVRLAVAQAMYVVATGALFLR
ncbi:MAG TPA: hypothetical protein VIV12_25805 [Streptosporangiaceae bacterium]